MESQISTATEQGAPGDMPEISAETSAQIQANEPGQVRVIRRNGKITPFDVTKIEVALTKAFLAVEGGTAAASPRVHETVKALAGQVMKMVTRSLPGGTGTVHIEDIQDAVELGLMRAGEHKVARDYVLYRERQAAKRAEEQAEAAPEAAAATHSGINVTHKDGSTQPLDEARVQYLIREACEDLQGVNADKIITDVMRNLYDGITEDELAQAMVLSARALIEEEPNYSFASARLLLDSARREALTFLGCEKQEATQAEMAEVYPEYFKDYLQAGIDNELIDSKLGQFDLDQLGAALAPERDRQFTYLGVQTLYDRYFIHKDDIRFELPQAFFMRVCMGLALNEVNREERAIEFYNVLSKFDFMSSTPTLFNSGTLRPQLSSCYLTTVPDELEGIYNAMRDNALLSKFAGGLGNDWTRVRSMGAYIKGTNGKSQGVVPFLKVANDTAVAVNQGGKRKGAVCSYLETWHLDIEEYLDLRKNTGDERRRTPDMNTANWIPDLFLQRVHEDKDWTLFSPADVPDLHDLTGKAFQEAYEGYEAKVERGEIKNTKKISAVQLWRKMLGMLFETGHPWMTFKDPCNLRSPQQHAGVVHSSNLCTEITLNTSDKEIAVCNLGSINLPRHITEDGQLDTEKLENTVNVAMRMLDNVIDINYYSVPQARRSNLRHRPVGLGIMGFQDALYKQRLPYDSEEAVEFADVAQEQISYFAIKASTDLAEERGAYDTFKGSLWDQGIMPYDSLNILEENRGGYLDVDRSIRLDWDSLRQRVQTVGMRNSNTMAIAPTATIANITGVSQSIEPTYQNLYVKSNLSGEFTVVNPYLIHDLKDRGLWDPVMAHDLKYYDGSVLPIDRIPDDLKAIYKCAFEIDAKWLVEAGSRRQKWIDQAQSLNLYLAEANGPKLDGLYKLAWTKGLKTTYYLRTMGATHAEKSTISDSKLNAVQGSAPTPQPVGSAAPKACSLDDPDCEACQ